MIVKYQRMKDGERKSPTHVIHRTNSENKSNENKKISQKQVSGADIFDTFIRLNKNKKSVARGTFVDEGTIQVYMFNVVEEAPWVMNPEDEITKISITNTEEAIVNDKLTVVRINNNIYNHLGVCDCVFS